MRYRYTCDDRGLWTMFDEWTKTVIAEGLTYKELDMLRLGIDYGMSLRK